jgi:hypothetical protein
MAAPVPAAHYVEDCGWIVTHTHDVDEAQRLAFEAACEQYGLTRDEIDGDYRPQLPAPVQTWLRTQPLRKSQQKAVGFRFLYQAPKAAGERGAYPAIEFPERWPIGLPCQTA